MAHAIYSPPLHWRNLGAGPNNKRQEMKFNKVHSFVLPFDSASAVSLNVVAQGSK
jgi:hypothetical protein